MDICDDTHTLAYLKDGQLPSKEGITSIEWKKLSKRVKKRAKEYMLINGNIFRQISKTYPTPRRVPPISERREVIKKAHDDMGHYGENRSIYIVAKSYYWPNMHADVKKYVQECESCQKSKASFKQRTTLNPLPLARLFERWSIDLVGPLLKSQRGHEYLVVAIEAHSRYIVAAPLPNRLSSTVAAFFFENCICKFSCPEVVLSDNGSEFDKEFSNLMARYGIKHIHSSPYSPQSNGFVEAANKTIVNSKRRSMLTHLNTWDDHVHKSVYAYNIARQASTGFSPFFLLFNQDARIGDPKDAAALTQTARLQQAAVADRTEQEKETTQEAVMNMAHAQEKQKESYSRRRPMDQPLYDTDTLVLIKRHVTGKGKFADKTDGPFMLRAYNKQHTTVIVEDAEGQQWTENAAFVCPYHPPPVAAATTTPPDSAPPAHRRKAPSSRKSKPSAPASESQ